MKKKTMIKSATFGTLFAVSTIAAALNLSSGWNLVGNNSAGPINVATTFADPAKVTTVWKWNKVTGKWAFYTPTMSNTALSTYVSDRGYELLTEINAKEGYWINGSGGVVVTPEGTNVPTGNELSNGWNLVVGAAGKTPGQLASTLNTGLSSAGQQVSTIWAWDNSSAKWKFFSSTLAAQGGTALADYISSKGYKAFDFISESDGIWVNVETSTTPPVVIDPACTYVPPTTITYPSEYNGSYPIPTPTGRLPSSISRTMNLKDVDVWWERPANSTCTDKNAWRTSVLLATLDRVQKLGVDRIWVYNYAQQWDDFSQPVWTVTESDYALPRSVLQTVVSEAHKRNIKVYYAYQFSSYCDSKGVCLDPGNLSPENFSKLLETHKKQIVSDGIFGAQIGLDGIKSELDNFHVKYPSYNSTSFREVYVSKVTSTIDELRTVFSGKLTFGQNNLIYDSRIISKVDSLTIPLYFGNDKKTFNVENWKNEISMYISWHQMWIQQEAGISNVSIPINWELYPESSTNYYSNNWIDNFCMNDAIAQNKCPQNSYTTDFSVQAIAVESAFEALSTQSIFTTGSITINAYAVTDTMVPTNLGGVTVFHNIDGSIRNKPAETIVKYWFGK